jgi:hypothetical protein
MTGEQKYDSVKRVPNHRGTLYTYSGKIGFPDGAPSLLDMAVSLSREGRYAGASFRFWPVALHTFAVCDMLPDRLKWDGLVHDSPEVITGDTPKPAKTDEIETFEEELLTSTYKAFKVSMLGAWERGVIKEADRKVFRGEIYTVGNHALQEFYPRCPEAEDFIMNYTGYTYDDMLNANGKVPMEFMRRFRLYHSWLEQRRNLPF